MRFIVQGAAVLAIVGVAACAPTIPDSASGVGFGDYDDYRRQQALRDAALTAQALPAPDAVSTETLVSGPSAPASDSDLLAAQTRAALESTRANSGEPVVDASPSNPAPQTVSTPAGISRENDFEAVGELRSIESDAERIAQNRAQYKVIEPTALPSRAGDTGPNIVAYALQTKHPVGTQVHRRVGLNAQSKYVRNCGKYASPDLAQADFLARGGPQRDRLGLDPDGDGYACSWDPAPFRKAVGG